MMGTSRRFFHRASALGLLIAAATVGWFAADHLLTEVSVMAISNDHGPMPTLRSGETVVVQVEASADRFIYCYYMDSARQVARISPTASSRTPSFPPVKKSKSRRARNRTSLQHPAGHGRGIEVITCLASSTELDRSRIDGTEIEDLTPIPGLELQDLLDAFGRLSATGSPQPDHAHQCRAGYGQPHASALETTGAAGWHISGIALAAVFHQEPQQRLETTDIDTVDDGPALTSGQHQPGVAQLGKVKDRVAGATPSRSASTPAGSPSGPS